MSDKQEQALRRAAEADERAAEEIRGRICVKTVGRQLEYLDCVDSTNTYAAARAQSGAPDGLVVVARKQTGGRGRCGRTFESESEKGIYMTAVLRPELPMQEVLPITAMAAVAACRAIERACGVRPGIKWTNDLVLHGKKLCGILAEMVPEGTSGRIRYVLLGIGINANQEAGDFSPEVADIATSIAVECGKPVCTRALLAALIEELDGAYARLGKDITADWKAYRQNCVTLGKEVRILKGAETYYGVAREIDREFGLVIERADGRMETVCSGEVSVRGLCGYA